jgi:hypothetical protein
MDLNYKIYKLNDIPWFIKDIADIYNTKWGWYYREEYNILTQLDMIDYIYNNHMNDIYIILTENFGFIGTLMFTKDNAVRKLECYPLISYLYINEIYTDYEVEYSNILINYANDGNEVYTWCYSFYQVEKYEKIGFKHIYDYKYNSYNIYILKKDEFVNR